MKLIKSNGFTLIEIIMIIAIIGIVAAISIPKFQDLSFEAKKNTCKSSLFSMREALSTWRMHNIVTNQSGNYPDIITLSTNNMVLLDIPPNPYQHKDNAPDSIVAGVTKGIVYGTRGGWAYNAATGEIWANTSTSLPGSGCAGPTNINENEW